MKIVISFCIWMLCVWCGFAADTELSKLKPFPEQVIYERDGMKFECGLYPGGKNEMPEAHRKAGEKIAATIVPMNAKGKEDKQNGKIVILAAGHSNPREYFNAYSAFIAEEGKKGTVNPAVTLQSMCHGGRMCADWAEMCKANPPGGGVSISQVLFLLTSYPGPSRRGSEQKYPEYFKLPLNQRIKKMKDDVKIILQAFAKGYPHLKLAYLGSDTWRGNTGLEPMVWEEAFVYKSIIEDQIKGDLELAFDGPNRKVPWLAWGGYIWENNPPKDRYVADGVHPSESGKAFAYGRWHEVLTKDGTSIPWFLNKK